MNTDVHLYENKHSYTNPNSYLYNIYIYICIRIYFYDGHQNDMLSYISVFL